MALQGCHELVSRLGRVQHGIKEGIPVRAGKHHALMVGESSASPFIREITCRFLHGANVWQSTFLYKGSSSR